MKKYIKPELFYENFEMSVGVASCSGIIIKDGELKEVVNGDKGYKEYLEETGLFGGGCRINYTTVDLQDYGYMGGAHSIFGS